MVQHSEMPDIEDGLRSLRADSLALLASVAGVIGYIWLMVLAWPETGCGLPATLWLGCLGLLGGAIGAGFLRNRAALPAALLLVTTIMGAILSTLTVFRLPGLAYLFAIPVALASVLLGPAATIVTGGVAIALLLQAGAAMLQAEPDSLTMLLPVAVTGAITMAAWLSQRNLYTALAWLWSAFNRSIANEEIVRRQSQELRQALKSLDEASHRLERANYMLSIARQQADEARRLKQRFAQTISHELRTPLNLIVGFAELMAHSPEYYGAALPPAYIRDLGILHRNARHLQSLLNDVLDLSRIEAAQMGLLLQEVQPDTLVYETVSTVRSLVESRGLVLGVDVAPDLPMLRVDPIRIRQVLFNLLNNAARFTEHGSVTVIARAEADEVVFAVADTGVGIPAEHIPRIFREFEQIEGGPPGGGRTQNGGIGLGLAISKSFVELHGGRIWVDSQPGVGSVFSFSLPLHASAVTIVDDELLSTAPRQRHSATTTRGEPILLAVTRSLSAAGLLSRYVRGARTVVVESMERAAEMAPRLLPQVVVIDAASISGDISSHRAMAKELAMAWSIPGVPFVICPLPGEELLRQRLAVDGYLIKPVTRDTLWDMLRRFGDAVDHILVIDDDKDFVRLLGRLLDDPVRRYDIISAHSGYEGLDWLTRRTPDLILLDLELPDIHGTEIITRLRECEEWRDIPVVVLSGQEEIDRAQVLDGGMLVSRANGLVPGELVQWIQCVVDTVTQAAVPGAGSPVRPPPAR